MKTAEEILPTLEEVKQAIKEIAKKSTAPDKETPDWMERDIQNGINWALNYVTQKLSQQPLSGEGSLREEFELESKRNANGVLALFELSNQQYINWLESKIKNNLLTPNKGLTAEEVKVPECSVCWGGGKIEIDDYGNEEDCSWCNGTGLSAPQEQKGGQE